MKKTLASKGTRGFLQL